ncbi:MAG: sporulation transcription factor Spo0A [Clostridiales bacterium]|nr:sporulation transcription factor Spo0A [Clostridiales bacterium]PWM40493.1 MAG: sporulation transcription factor Spo0A [Clostridiales bacterium]
MEKRLKVLISENGADFVREYVPALEEAGMTVVCTERDGRSLLERIEAEHPDVVLADLFMPRLDGIGVMKACAGKKDMPAFVILSNFTSPALEREVMGSGASYFMVSPFEAGELAQRVQQIAGTGTAAPARGGEEPLEIQVTEILHQIGVPAHIKGYHYLRDSILMAVRTPEIINAVTKQLYPSVAKDYETTPSRVERAIRHAIEVAWDRGDVDVLTGYFGYTIHNTRGKPTNSEFIAMISDRLRLHMKSAG